MSSTCAHIIYRIFNLLASLDRANATSISIDPANCWQHRQIELLRAREYAVKKLYYENLSISPIDPIPNIGPEHEKHPYSCKDLPIYRTQ